MNIKSSLKEISFINTVLDFDKLRPISYKNVNFDIAKKNSPSFILPVLLKIESMLERKHKYISVDLKFHYLKKNEVPCIEGWHVDSEPDLSKNELLENHFIYLLGENSLTEFIDSEIDLEIPKLNHIKSYQEQIDNLDYKVKRLEEKKIYNYSRFDFHRGQVALDDGWRILLRVSEQSKITPSRLWKEKPSFKRIIKE